MPSLVPSPFPKSRIPAWERRHRPEHWRWNGRRRTDPSLPSLGRIDRDHSRQILTWAFAGSLLCLVLFFLIFL
jgi:hypothetical protein